MSLLILAGFLPTAARAGNEPIFAAAPDWVEKPQAPAANPKLSEQPFQLLLYTVQTSHSPDASTTYMETMGKVQAAEVLTASGTVSIPWQPDRSDLIIHKLEVIRDGVSRDILADQKFSVLRREANLEAALVDGLLTATIQPEDLRVGDIIHFAYSIRSKPGSIGFKPEDSLSIRPGMKAGLILFREIWPDSVAMRWAASPAMGKLKVSKTKLGNELRAEFHNTDVPLPPPYAPARFVDTMYLEATAYRDWAEVSSLLAPFYAKAAALPENSPLKAEAQTIRDATPAPKSRAMAALRLVQDKVRYLALQMNEGGYIPASAEETWARRFGDCKGKAVTLIALLKELGIEAEPILINSVAGDALPGRLPRARMFDHVIVHATIEGKSYWFDGTRSGDRDIEELASSRFRFGLPVRESGAKLIELPLSPPLKPLVEIKLLYDASAGLFVPAKVQGETTFRGELATALRLTLAQIGEAEFKKGFDSDKYLPGTTDRLVQFKADPNEGTFTVSFSGKRAMDWNKTRELASPRFRFQDSSMQWRPDFKAREADAAQVPFRLDFPVNIQLREDVILPAGGKGYSLQGKDFDRTAAGTRITRSLKLENGRAVATSTFVRLQPELPVAEALVSVAALAEISADAAYVTSAEDMEIRPWSPLREPTTAEEYIARGYDRLDIQHRTYATTDFDKSIEFLKDALGDFDRAVELTPGSSLGHSLRALALIELGRLDEADTALKKAFAFDRIHPRAYQMRGMLNARRGRYEESIADYSRYLSEYNPRSAKSLFERALAYEKTGQLEKARADLQLSGDIVPDSQSPKALARVTARLGNVKEAVALLDKFVPELSGSAVPAWRKTTQRAIYRGRTLEAAGRADMARLEYQAALREIDQRLKQLPAPSAAAFDPEVGGLLVTKVNLLGAMRRVPEAIAVADQLLKLQPANAPMLTERCRVRLLAPDQLAMARQDCDAARHYDPSSTESMFVSGLVSLKANDWTRATKEFEQLTKRANILALLGRGIAKIRSGKGADGRADIELVDAVVFDAEAEFRRFGISPEANAEADAAKPKLGLTVYTWTGSGEPVTAEDFLSRGYSRSDKLQLKEAIEDYDRAIQLAPDSSRLYSLRALALVRLARLDEAEADLRKANSLKPVEPRTSQVKGMLEARRGHPEEAIRDLSRDLQPDGDSIVWLTERGLAYEQTGQLEKARADFQRALDLLPSTRRRVLLARVMARLGKFAEANAIVDPSAIDTTNMSPWRKTYILVQRRGKVFSMAGRPEQARAEYDAALVEVDARIKQFPPPQGPVLSGEPLRLLKAKVDLLIRTDRVQDAIAIADRALKVQPDNVSMLTARCEARLHAAAQLPLARADCDAARRSDPADNEAMYRSGLVALKAKDWSRAASEFEAFAKVAPNAPAALFGRGIVKLRRGDRTGGGADIERARTLSAEVEPEFAEVGVTP